MSYMTDETYEIVTESVPIICVDILPARKRSGRWEIGIIQRATGSQKQKPCVLGGRIWKDEAIMDSIKRHLSTDLAVTDFSFIGAQTESSPFYVQQYFKQDTVSGQYGYDPSKHAVALTYLVTLSEDPRPKNEASGYSWLTSETLPKVTGYNQIVVMQAAFTFLRGLE